MLQDFKSVYDYFETLCINRLRENIFTLLNAYADEVINVEKFALLRSVNKPRNSDLSLLAI